MNLLTPALLGTLLASTAALITSVAVGYCCAAWRRRRTPQHWPRLASALPVTVGVLVGLLALLPFLDRILTGDRFYSPEAGLQVYRATAAALVGLILIIGSALLISQKHPTGARLSRWGGWTFFGFVLMLSTLLAMNGLQFGVLGAGLEQEVNLGRAAVPLSVAWLVVAAYALRLLDGLHGAVPAVLGSAAVAVGWMSYANEARMVAAMCAVMAGGAFGSLRFHAVPYPSLPLRGPGTVCFGLLFAMLTLIARQKTVATLLLLFPLALAILLLGAAMLATLERSLQPGNGDQTAEEDPDSPPLNPSNRGEGGPGPSGNPHP